MLTSRSAFLIVSTLAASMGLLPSAVAIGAEPGITLEQVLRAWRQREERVRSFRFQWEERHTVTKGHWLSGKESERINPQKRISPPKTTTSNRHHSLTMEGNKLRYPSRRPRVGRDPQQQGVYQEGGMVSTSEYYKAFGKQSGPKPFPQGIICTPMDNGQYRTQFPQIPLLLIFRALQPFQGTLHNVSEHFALLPDRSVVAGRLCVVLRTPPLPPGNSRVTLWLDPGRDFVIVRMRRGDDGRTTTRQVTYSDFRQTEHGWVPLKWTLADLRLDESIAMSLNATVQSFELNMPVDEKEFDIEFPPDTWVIDLRGEERQYIVKEGSEKRDILREELIGGGTYEQFLTTEPGGALEKPQRSHQHWVWWSVAAVVLGIVALILVRLRIRFKKEPPGVAAQ